MSSTDLQICTESFALWGAGGYHGAEKDANFDKYMAADLVVDYRFGATVPDLKRFDGIFIGKAGFFENMGIHELIEWRDLKTNIFADGSAVFIHMDCLPVRRSTGKAASSRLQCLLQIFLVDGKASRSVYYFSNGAAVNEVFNS